LEKEGLGRRKDAERRKVRWGRIVGHSAPWVWPGGGVVADPARGMSGTALCGVGVWCVAGCTPHGKELVDAVV